MLGWPGMPATAVTRPPPTAGPRLRKRMFSRMSLGLGLGLVSSAARATSGRASALTSASFHTNEHVFIESLLQGEAIGLFRTRSDASGRSAARAETEWIRGVDGSRG